MCGIRCSVVAEWELGQRTVKGGYYERFQQQREFKLKYISTCSFTKLVLFNRTCQVIMDIYFLPDVHMSRGLGGEDYLPDKYRFNFQDLDRSIDHRC